MQVACAEGLGVPRGSPMFRHVLQAIAFVQVEKITPKVEYLKETFRWSDAEVGIADSTAPAMLAKGKDMLQRLSEFFISEVGGNRRALLIAQYCSLLAWRDGSGPGTML